MKTSRKLLAAAVLVALSSPAFAEIEFDVIGGSEITFEGLVQGDMYWYNNDVVNLAGTSFANQNDGEDHDFGNRRAELVFKGKGPGMFNWVVGYDPSLQRWLDVNVQYKFSGFTYLQVGQFKQPNSLEELSSTKNNDFISKAMNTNMQGVARRVGIGAGTGADNWGVVGSVFTRELTRNNNGEGNGYGARGYWAPIYDTSSADYLHLGLSYVNFEARDRGTGTSGDNDGDGHIQIRVRPDADLAANRLVSSPAIIDGERVKTMGFEGMWIHGPFKVQSEYMKSELGRNDHDNFDFDGWYISGVWNITGENFGYKNGVPTTPLPNDPSKGMWQVGLRYDAVDLNDGSLITPTSIDGILGGKEHNWTVGVNYYWHSNFKFALNYVDVKSEKYNNSPSVHAYVDDDPSIIEFRAQIYW